MAKYETGESRAWALESLTGLCGCVLPTFSTDLSTLNEAAIRHDVRREKELGMAGILIVSETGTTLDEYRQLIDICVDEAGEDLVTVVHGSHPTFEATIASAEHGEHVGADLMLLSYPLTYYPTSIDEIYADTKRVADATNLGIIVFAMDLWNFSRLHPASFPTSLLERMVESCPNIAVIKNEVSYPYAGGLVDVFERFRDVVLVTDPMESNMPIWVKTYGMRFAGTSNYEYAGDRLPKVLGLLSSPDTWSEGMEIWWQLDAARKANYSVVGLAQQGTYLVSRALWKYQGWLMGFNGGPLRQPLPRIHTDQMKALRRGAVASGLSVTDAPDELFWVGRNPT
jgi:4-hydroxy-tetrahydrodipicolinate synthase